MGHLPLLGIGMDKHDKNQKHESDTTGLDVPKDSSRHAQTHLEGWADKEYIPGVGYGIPGSSNMGYNVRVTAYNESKWGQKYVPEEVKKTAKYGNPEKILITEDEIISMAAEIKLKRAMDAEQGKEGKLRFGDARRATHEGTDTIDPSKDRLSFHKTNDHFKLDTSESRIFIGVTDSTGTWLNGSSIKSQRFIHIRLTTPTGRHYCDVAMTFEQFAAALLSPSDHPCTMTSYWSVNDENVLLKERVKPPESIDKRMEKRLADNLKENDEVLLNVVKQMQESVEAGKAMSKTKLAELIRDLERAHEHRLENSKFVVTQAKEETAKILESAAIHLSQTFGGGALTAGKIAAATNLLPESNSKDG